MVTTLCGSLITPSPSSSSAAISKFISDQPYLSMLHNKCSCMKDLHKIHAQLIKTGLARDPIACSRVLAFCTSRAGDINYAYLVFTQIQNPNLFVWNTIIRGFSKSSVPQQAIHLFIRMLFTSPSPPQTLTYPSVFKAYAQLGLARQGSQLHARVIKLGLEDDNFIRNTILYMYSSCGFLSEAWRVFDATLELDVVGWNTMIMGLAKCGEVDESRRLFEEMSCNRNTVSWNSMISGYARNGRFVEALELFRKMQQQKIEPSEFTMVSLLNACACLGAIRQGEWLHDYIVRKNLVMNSIVVTAIIDMYSKCGSIDNALQVFKTATNRGLSCWNSMILGLAMNGRVNEATQVFSTLECSSSLRPDCVSFIGVLMACSHGGLVDKAKEYFLLMTETYGIKPSIKHYGCLVDALGRAGLLEEAEELIRSMPVDADAAIWGSLISSCRKHGNIEMAKRAALHLVDLDPGESSGFVVMSNMYAASSRFEEAIHQRMSMKQKQIEKEPGCSLVEVNGEVHEFIAGGRLHQKAKEIYHLLENLGMASRGMG
ncbi:hypothetical protein Tsubulata_037483 [Turnera subulata]|uniref:Pentacotripeptide-repeat region of PRORP domain-containing protein n=1 Tax=Turnera subulata TaxID=218843 RepID=A0A9Q0J223_9ROSI|nr:hypothetical protein Tsubulata_037483 [Turnera subulata]